MAINWNMSKFYQTPVSTTSKRCCTPRKDSDLCPTIREKTLLYALTAFNSQCPLVQSWGLIYKTTRRILTTPLFLGFVGCRWSHLLVSRPHLGGLFQLPGTYHWTLDRMFPFLCVLHFFLWCWSFWKYICLFLRDKLWQLQLQLSTISNGVL